MRSCYRIILLLCLITGFIAGPVPGVQAQLSFSAEVNKSFSPISIVAGEVSRLSVTIYNPNAFAMANTAWTDNLVGVQPGIRIANPVSLTNSCGGSVTAVAGATTLSLSGGTVAAQVGSNPGTCTVAVNVTSTTPGNLINTIPAGGLTATGGGGNVSNSTPASATLNVDVVQPPSLNKNFNPNTMWIGQTSQLTINIINSDLTNALTQTTLTDTLPLGVVLASPVASSLTGCGSATLTAVSGTRPLTLNNATIAANTTCVIKVNVTSITEGVYTNNIPASAISTKQGVTNAGNAAANLNVQAVSISKAFLPTSFVAGETTTLTITLNNPTTSDYTGVNLTDTLPGVLEVVAGSAATDCGSGTEASTTLPNIVSLIAGTIPAGTLSTPGSCTITVQVTAPLGASNATYTNTIPAGTLETDQLVTNVLPASADVTVQAVSIGVAKVFVPARIEAGSTSTLTITLQNNTANDFTGVFFTDTLPAPLIVATPSNVDTTCGAGIVSTTSNTVSLTGGTVPARTLSGPSTCTVTVDVEAPAGTTTNTFTNIIPIGDVQADGGITNQSSGSDDLDVYTAGQGVTGTKAFTNNSINVGGTSTLTIDLFAPADQDLHNVSFVDHLPANVTASSVSATSGCGRIAAQIVIVPNTQVSFTGGTILAGARCRIQVVVTSSVPGIYTNIIQPVDITNDEGQTLPSNRSATLRVSNYTISKIFYPNTVSPNGISTLTITLQNTNLVPLINVDLTDSLTSMGGDASNGVFVAPTPNASTTCSGGDVSSIVGGSQTITMTGGTVPAQVGAIPGICTILVNVQGKGSSGTRTNTIPILDVTGTIQGTGTLINPVSPATAPLTITNLTIGIVKGFDPLTVFGGSASTLSIQLINPNNAVLSGIAFTDTMPAGMYIATPANLSTGTCGGTLTGNPGDTTFSFSGGALSASRRCTLTLSASMNVGGNRTNTIAANAVTTFNGAKNPQPTQATLTNLPGASISKYFNPSTILAEPGQYSTLTITIQNTGNFDLTGMGLLDGLPGTLPAGLMIAGAPAPAPDSDCGGTLTAVVGSQTIQLIGGGILASSSCTIVVPVTSTVPGVYVNTIPAGALDTLEHATNVLPAEDTLRVTSAPELQIVKSVTNSAPYTLGNPINYSIVVTNLGNITLTNVTVVDADPGVVLGICTPDPQPATLAVGASMTCPASHLVDAADATAGSYTNTAVGDSDQTPPASDSVTVPINLAPALTVDKTATKPGPHYMGDTLTYTITVRNIGGTALTGVVVTDAGIGATLGACVPAQPAALAVGASMVCAATHVVTQADVDAGTYTNTAVGSGDPPSGPPLTDDDTVVVPISQNPALAVFKQFTSNPPYILGSTITYDIAVLNTGNQTLTGVRVTDPGVGVTLGACIPAAPATLAPGEFMSCAASHVVTQVDMDASSYSNTAFGDSDQTGPDNDTRKATFTQTPAITLAKTGTVNMNIVPPNLVANVGDTITYAFTVTNTGNVTLTNITLSDTIPGVSISGGPIASLAPGAADSTTFTGLVTLTQAIINAGTFYNTATVTGTPPNGLPNETATDDDTRTITAVRTIDLQKNGTLNLDASAPTGIANPGDTITYAFIVTNTGNVTLTNVTLTDPVITVFGGPIASLAPGASDSTTFTGIYTLTQANVDAGTFTNTATVRGTPPSGPNATDTDNDTQTLPPLPSIDLVKTGTLHMDVVAPNGVPNPGDTITYVFTVTNTGNVTLTNVTITDPEATIIGGPIPSLAPGASDSTTFTGTHILTVANLDAGTYTNTATARGTPPSGPNVTDPASDTQTLTQSPSIDLQKTGTVDMSVVAPNVEANAGDIIHYTFTVTNTGNVTLTNITLADAILGVSISGGPIASLAPGAVDSTTFTGTYTLLQADVDDKTFINSATITGTPPGGPPNVTDSDDDTQTLNEVPAITLLKEGTPVFIDGIPNVGETITYAFTVTNTGNVTLTNVTITDPLITVNGGPIASLAPGAVDSTTFTGTYILTQADVDAGTFTNIATVTGTPPHGTNPTDTDDDTQDLDSAPVIGVAKRVVGDPVKVPGQTGYWDVTFEILVHNYGNVTLDNIQVTDDLSATFPIPTTFAVQSVDSTDFAENWPGYDGLTDQNLLEGTDTLPVNEEGTITLVVRVVPVSEYVYLNTAVGSGDPPSGPPVTDDSQDGTDPDPDDDGPADDDDPTPVDFGSNLFDPPMGIKTVDVSGRPIFRWTMNWINDTNIVAINAAVSDGIPVGTTFVDDLVSSGYPLPGGTLPAGTTNTGVACVDSSAVTSTDYCYYEGPTLTYPRGRIIWQGVLGPDLGATDALMAVNDIQITFSVTLQNGRTGVHNTATIDSDLNGDGDTTDTGELQVASATASWAAPSLPETGFAPGVMTWLPDQPEELAYSDLGSVWMEIPDLGIKLPIVGVPLTVDGWDVTWLRDQAGWLGSTAFPGWAGNSVVTAHVYDANGLAGAFVHIDTLSWGDKIIVHAYGSVYTYEVRQVLSLAPDNMSPLKHEDKAWLTLLTCRYFDEKTDTYLQRLAVRAVLVKTE